MIIKNNHHEVDTINSNHIIFVSKKNGTFKSLIYNNYFILCLAVAKVRRKKEEKGKGKSKLFSVHVFGYKKKRKEG